MTVSHSHLIAAHDNAALCAAVWRAHDLDVERRAGCVICSGTPPRFYPHLVTVDPDVEPDKQTRLIGERASGAFLVKDSFRKLDLSRLGFAPMFEPHWIRRRAGLGLHSARLDWRAVTEAAELGAWEAASGGTADAPRIFLPSLLATPEMTFLAGRMGGAIAAGCVVTTAGEATGLSNVFGDASEAISAAAKMFPARDLVGYESGEAWPPRLRRDSRLTATS